MPNVAVRLDYKPPLKTVEGLDLTLLTVRLCMCILGGLCWKLNLSRVNTTAAAIIAWSNQEAME